MLFVLCFAIFFTTLYGVYLLMGWAMALAFAFVVYFPYPKLQFLIPLPKPVTYLDEVPIDSLDKATLFVFLGNSPILYEFLNAAVFNRLGHVHYVTPVVPQYYTLIPFVCTVLRVWGVRSISQLRELVRTGQSVAVMASSNREMVHNYVIEQAGKFFIDSQSTYHYLRYHTGAEHISYTTVVIWPDERTHTYFKFLPRLQQFLTRYKLLVPLFIPVDLTRMRAIELRRKRADSYHQSHIDMAATAKDTV